MSSDTAANLPHADAYTATVLGPTDAGEVLTLQRAAYVTEAQTYHDMGLPPLTQSIAELRQELADLNVLALGVRDNGRLVGAVRLHRCGTAVDLGRLTVAPDRQGQGIGSFLLREAESAFPDIRELRLFTGERSTANIRLYQRTGYVETGRVNGGNYWLVHFAKKLD
ncbi:MAG TPA: GNAT family N-acetyltransferase [Pseudoclavibacter sp.]|nr:GNAT family N-acetyltransferase [Pseudoclavibacter sp.]